MIISLCSELQNIPYSVKYKKLDEATEKVKAMTIRYLSIEENRSNSL